MASNADHSATALDLSTYYQDLRVAIYRGDSFYSDYPPFNPDIAYAEYIFAEEISSEANPAYKAIRNCFQLLGLDARNVGSSRWNPLGDLIQPGEKVVIKPNLVLSSHYEGGNLFSIITHPSILRAIIDYVYKALNGLGEIIIADAPQMDCNFNEMFEKTALSSIQELYWRKQKFEIKILDLRDFWLDLGPGNSRVFAGNRRKLSGDELGSAIINLGTKSGFYNQKNSQRYYGADYNRGETIQHHQGKVQEYMISKTALSADILVLVPKLKVHKKVGVTLNCKGLVGINTNKNYLVHYTLGTPTEGGDQFPDGFLDSRENFIIMVQRILSDILLARKMRILDAIYTSIVTGHKKLLKPLMGSVEKSKLNFDGGNWYGNDSAWRMVTDLTKIALYADESGKIRNNPQRKIFSVIDGIIGGEGNGPLIPTEKRAGVVIAGRNPVAVDIVGTRLMGFNWQRLKWLGDLVENIHFDFYIHNPDQIQVFSNIPMRNDFFKGNSKLLGFRPHPGWEGHIEVT